VIKIDHQKLGTILIEQDFIVKKMFEFV